LPARYSFTYIKNDERWLIVDHHQKEDVVWFALNDDRPSPAAGPNSRVTGAPINAGPRPSPVYGFLTTAPNAINEPIHPKAMPVILTTVEERDVWMRTVGRSQGPATAVAG
jgi:putative SOS response-associated peptidase YedK